jgi:cytidine deaminase
MTSSDEALLDAADRARANAYAPYSGFRVGAAVEAADGRVFLGCNVENASYGMTICAERAAVSAAISAGARDLVRVGITTETSEAVAPCGACRQVLAEFGRRMHVVSRGGDHVSHWRLDELLPAQFAFDRTDPNDKDPT